MGRVQWHNAVTKPIIFFIHLQLLKLSIEMSMDNIPMTSRIYHQIRKLGRCLTPIFFIVVFITAGWGCRLWAVLASDGRDLYNPGTVDLSCLYQELYLLQQQGGLPTNSWPYNNNDGWGISYYYQPGFHLMLNTIRSSEPAAIDSILFENTITSVLSPLNHTNIAMGHVRTASSGAISIPNPHPFVFQDSAVTYTFIHNGSVDKSTLLNLLTDDETDYSWINQHPPQTYGYGDWQTDGWDYVVDSELFFLWLVQSIQQNDGDINLGMNQALAVFEQVRPDDHKNFIFSDGEDLYVYRSNMLDFPNLYYALPTNNIFHYAIMSSPPTTGPAGELNWVEIPHRSLVKFSPGGLINVDDHLFPGLLSSETDVVPAAMNLSNYPNPFNSNTRINFTIPNSAPVWLRLIDINGKTVRRFSEGEVFSPGEYQFLWNGKDSSGNAMSSGIYFIRLHTDAVSDVRKIILVRGLYG